MASSVRKVPRFDKASASARISVLTNDPALALEAKHANWAKFVVAAGNNVLEGKLTIHLCSRCEALRGPERGFSLKPYSHP
jgi:hypothetical protein